ncbi:MAG TPA: TlpA disulfide reductase family protein [Myxococcaceae bacterium]|nr:TlpA disulfide reductase family protein [Myxococcaceae bacterium]
MRARTLLLALAPLLLSALCSLPGLPGPARATPTPPPEPPAAPAFSLPTRDGTVALDSLRGKAVLVDFWASWCEPCRQSFPWMRSVYDSLASRGLTIVAINLDKSRAAAESFLRKYPAPFPVAFDPSGSTADAYHVSAMPSSFIVSPEGKLLHAHRGFLAKDAPALEALLKKACPK